MFAKLISYLSIAASSLQATLCFVTTRYSHRLVERSLLQFFVCLAVMAAQPLGAQEQVKISPAGVVTWDELLTFQQSRAIYAKQPRVIPLMPAPGSRSLGVAEGTLRPLAPQVQEFVGRGGEPLIPVEDDFQALPDNNAAIPPDTMGAAGPNHLMTMLNTQVRIQDKSGNNLSTVTLDTFWTSPGTGLSGNPFDPRLVYDSLANRWLATVDADSRSADSAVWFAVSDNSDPTGNWTFYAIDADPTDADWADFPDIGFNSKWVAITNNMFTVFDDSLSGVKMWVIEKSSLGQDPLVFTPFDTGFDTAGGSNGFTLRPAATLDAAEENLYIADNGFLIFGGVVLLRLSMITGPADSPSWSVVPDAAGFFPGTGFFLVSNNFNLSQIDASQLGTATRVSTNDPRLLNAVLRDGRLWTTHSGGLPAGGAADRTAVFWYELDPDLLNTTGDPIVQSGVLDGGSGVHHFFPSIAVNSINDVALGFSRSDSTRFVEGVVTGRKSSDPAGSMDAITVIKGGEDSYVKDFGSGQVRWGDYSATVVDPDDDLTFWTIQQYAATDVGPDPDDDRWGTWWAQLKYIQADFTADVVSGMLPLQVNFTDQTAAAVTSWQWNFGDATTSTEQNPTHTYIVPGNYTVSLTVTGPEGSDTETKTDYIKVEYPVPTANFTANRTSGEAPLTVAFADQSTGFATEWLWDFGDATSSTNQNPTHTYTAAGSYRVSLRVTNPGGSDTETKDSYVTVSSSRGGGGGGVCFIATAAPSAPLFYFLFW